MAEQQRPDEAIQEGRPVGLWVPVLVVTFIALRVIPISIPAAIGSFARRITRRRTE